VKFIALNCNPERFRSKRSGARALPSTATNALEICRSAEQLDDVPQESPRPAAVEAAMIEAEREFGLRGGNELLFLLAPRGRFLSGAEAEQKRLIGQGNWRAPIQAKGAEI